MRLSVPNYHLLTLGWAGIYSSVASALLEHTWPWIPCWKKKTKPLEKPGHPGTNARRNSLRHILEGFLLFLPGLLAQVSCTLSFLSVCLR